MAPVSADFSTQYAWFRIDARRAGCVRLAGARGFTLIELMAAILIVALLVAVALPSYAAMIKKQRIGQAIRDLSKLAGDIERYRTVHFAAPMSLAEIGAGGMRDPWGNPYQYLSFDDPSPGIKGRFARITISTRSTATSISIAAAPTATRSSSYRQGQPRRHHLCARWILHRSRRGLLMAGRHGPTRIESRTLWLFVASALLPIAAFAVLGFVVVSGELHKTAQRQLDAAARSYGFAIFDRLQLMDMRLAGMARRYLQDDLTAAEISAASDDRATIRVLQGQVSIPAGTSDPIAIGHRLLTVRRDGADVVTLEVSGHNSSGAIRLEAEFKPEYLWNADESLLAESSACVATPEGVVIHCTSALSANHDNNELQSDWKLFLNAVFGVSYWRIDMRQSGTLLSRRSMRFAGFCRCQRVSRSQLLCCWVRYSFVAVMRRCAFLRRRRVALRDRISPSPYPLNHATSTGDWHAHSTAWPAICVTNLHCSPALPASTR